MCLDVAHMHQMHLSILIEYPEFSPGWSVDVLNVVQASQHFLSCVYRWGEDDVLARIYKYVIVEGLQVCILPESTVEIICNRFMFCKRRSLHKLRTVDLASQWSCEPPEH